MSATEQTQALVKTSPLILELAADWKMNAATMIETLKATVFPQKDSNGNAIVVSNAQLMAFLQVAHEYRLNPFLREVYAFPTKGGGIVPMVPIDGWANIVNRNSQMDGMEFVDEWELDQNNARKSLIPFSTTCVIYRKDRSRPIKVTEYFHECNQPTKEPWKKWPARMLRHKAMIQCARIAFSLGGIYDPDEAERIAESGDGGKAEIRRPTTIEATQSSSPATVQGTDAGAAPASAVESSTVSDQPGQAAPARNSGQNGDAKPETAAVGDMPEMPGTASPKCFCSCCKKAVCDCIDKEEIDQCGCPPCKKYMALVRENPERQGGESREEFERDRFGTAGPVSKPKPEGPYAPQERLKKLFAAAAGAGIKVVKDSHDDDLHRILKEKWGIESVKEIPLAIFDEVVRTIAPNLKVK